MPPGGKYRRVDKLSLSRVIEGNTFPTVGDSPKDIDIAEVHDTRAFGEIYQAEKMRLRFMGEDG